MTALDSARRSLLGAGPGGRDRRLDQPRLTEAPLSPGQERLWFLLHALPDAAAYNMAVRIPIPDRAAPELVRAAWDLLAQRHPALRTVFVPGPDGVTQRIVADPAALPEWQLVDLSSAPAHRAEAAASAWMASTARLPFSELDARAPVRAALLLLPRGRRVLVVAMHHILSDGWSMQILRRDLQELLAALLSGRPAALPVLGRDHLDYAVDRRAQASSPQLAAARAWWRAELAGLAGPLELPTDVPRGSQPADGASLGVLVGTDAVAALRRLCEECDTTLFAGVLAVVSALLHRLTGADDIPIGTPRAQRAPDETELVGFCVATLLLRLRIDPAASFRTHLLAARDTVQGAFEHEDVPFEVVSADAGARRGQGENPLFETMCALQDTPGRVLDSAGPVPEDPQPCVARFELSFYFTEVIEGLLGSVEYRSDLFSAARIRRCRDQLLMLWEAAASSPDTPLRDLAIEGPAEAAARLRVSAGPPREVTPVASAVARMLATRGGYPALRGDGVELSYAELADRVGRWLAGFADAGLIRGDRLVVALDRGVDAVAAALACLLARVGYVPLDPQDPPARLAQLVESCGARAVAAEAGADWRAGRPIVRPGAAAVPATPVEGSGDDCAYVIHTSGSTGQPKAAAVAHRTLDNLIGWQLEHGCAPATAVTLQYAPLGFDVSLQEMLSTLAGGGTLVLIDRDDRRDAHATLDVCARYGVERVFLPPLVLRELAQAARLRPDGAELREVICAGEALIVPDGMARLLAPGGVLVNQYGPAETHVVTAHTLTGDPAGWPTVPPIGTPISNVHVEVRDDAGAPVPLGSPGELVIAGPAVGLGYLGDPGNSRFGSVEIGGVRMPSYATGDRVVQRDDGCLVYLGRADRQVKVRGFRIEPAEVEAALEALPGVRAAAVDAVQAPSGRRVLAAWVEADQPRDWRADLAGVLPRHLIPDTVTRLDQLARTSSGKVDRVRLADSDASEPAGDLSDGVSDVSDGVASNVSDGVSDVSDGGSGAVSDGGVRAVVRDLWEQLLHCAVARDDIAFFDLGGDSLLAMRLATRLHDRLGLPVSVREVFEHPGVAALAAHLHARGARPLDGEPAPDGAAVAGVFPATDNQAGLWFLDQLDPEHTAYQLTMDLALPRGTTRQQAAAALTVLAARHPALRTSLREQDGVLVQDVTPPAAVDVREVRLPDPGPAADPDAARTLERQLIAAERDAGCDLRAGPLFRALLVRTASGESRLVLVLHHAIADGWSLDVLRAELAAVLDGWQLGPAPRSFAEWAAEQADDAEHRAYWTAALAGADLVLDLPSDRPRPATPSWRGATRAAVVDARTAQRLRALAAAAGTTPFAALLAAASVLLGRLARTEDLLLGVPMANRAGRGLEQSVGYFANSVVVRAQPAPSATFRELVAAVGARLLDAQAHQALPFERLVRLVQPHREAGRHPVFSVMCSYDAPAPGSAPELDLAAVDPDRVQDSSAKYDLSFAFEPVGDALVVGIEYRTDLFDHATAAGWLAALRALLDSAAAEPDVAIERLSAGRARHVDRSLPPPYPATGVAARVLARAADRPDSIAVVGSRAEPSAAEPSAAERSDAELSDAELGPAEPDSDQLRYAELVARAGALASRLAEYPTGSRVGVLAGPGPQLAIGWLGVLLAGHTLVPLDPELPPARLRVICDSAGVAAVVVGDGAAAGWLDGPPRLDVPRAGDDARPVSRPSDAPAYLLFTSGSTGVPKGVLVSRPALDRYLADVRGMFELTARDRVLQFASPGFDVAIEEVLGALAAGAAVIPRPSGAVPAAELMALCEWHGVTVLSVPTSYLPLITDWARRRRLPATIRLAVVGGQQLDPDVLRAWATTGVPLWNMYGPTEATISAVAARLTGPPAGRVPIGAALPSARAYVLDPSGRPQPDYLPGEICIGGGCLADGYVGAESSAAFRPDPFSPRPGARMYRTGDLGWTRADGQLVYLGRLDDQAKVRGFRVELGEIEAALRSEPGVREAMAAVTGQEQIVAAVTRDDAGAGFDADATRAALARRLPRYMVPAVLRCLPQLPYTPSGKPDRAALATMAAGEIEGQATSGIGRPAGETGQPAGDSGQPASGSSRSPDELGRRTDGLVGSAAEIADLWQALLGRRPATVEDDFFAAGGHSLLALRLLDRLAADLGARLTVGELFAASRLGDLAALVDERRSDATAATAAAIPMIPHDPDPSGPATPAQARLWYVEQAAPSGAYNLALRIDVDEPVLPSALDAAVSALAARHPTLRTLLVGAGNGCRQHVQPPPAEVLRWVDLSDTTSELLDAVLAADAGRPFELAVEHPYRAVAVSLAPDRHVLQLTFHHCAVDGLSIPILRRDLAEGYRLALRGCPPVSAPAEPSYLDYARWAAGRPGRAELLDRATAALDGAPADIALPYDRTGPYADPARGVLVAFPLPPGTLRAVDELAAAQDSTRFAVLAAAWCAFLARLSGQDDLVIGTPLANRTNPATAGLVGCFVNTLPLRVRACRELSWAELARATAASVGELLDLQDVALDEVVSRLRRAGGDESPLPFQTCFVVQEADGAGVQPQWSGPRRWPVKFDLALSLEVAGEAAQGFLEARSDRLDDATVQVWAGWFAAFLTALTADPGARLQDLDWQPEQPPISSHGPRNGSLDPLQGFLRHLRTGPERPAVSTPAGRWTRADLAALAAEVAGELAAAGVVEGDRVALAIADPARRIAAELACLAAGAAFVPLDVRQPDGRRARILAAAEVRTVLRDQPGPASSHPASAKPALRFHPVDPALPAYVMFTSGSTGAPKGVVIGRGALAAHVASYGPLLSIDASDVCSHLASPTFDAAIAEVMPALAAGAQIVTPPGEVVADARALLGWLAEAGVTVAFAPTPLGELLFAELERDPSATPPALRVLYVGGAQLRRRPPPGPFRVLNLYGPTETTVAATWAEVSGDDGWGLPPIGTPLAGTTAHVLTADGAPCAPGQPGELYIGGDKVGLGYLNDPERTRAVFVASPDGDGSVAYRTGDIVRWRSDGSLDYLGRADRQVQLRGVRVEPAEVEAALLRLPGVRQAHAAPLGSSTGGDPVLAAWLVVDEPQGEAARRRMIAAELPAAMVPARIAELAALPLTGSGKIDGRALQRLLPADVPGPPEAADTDPMVGWWTATLGRLLGRAIGPDTDFFAAGGHSLLAARALALARDELGIDLRVHQIFTTPTARELAEATLDAAELALDRGELTLDGGELDEASLTSDESGLTSGHAGLTLDTADPPLTSARAGEVAS